MKKILIIEDEPGIRVSVRDEFASLGYEIVTAENGTAGLEAARRTKPDLILLDIKLPGIDGYTVCQRLRGEGDRTPIIILTVKDRELDKILGLELGADDYLTKPFSLRELEARVKAVLRRAAEREIGIGEYRFGRVKLNFRKYEAEKSGRKLELTRVEFDLLRLLVEKKDRVLTRGEILDAIWGEDNVCVSERTIDSHIANIRRKIEDRPDAPKHVLSVRGVGYKFVD